MSERVLFSFMTALGSPQPPSNNDLYTPGIRGRLVLSREGREYKAALTQVVVGACLRLPWKKAIEAVYEQRAWVRVTIALHGKIFNASWRPRAKTRKGNLKSPYKKMDGPNYLKVIEDAIAAGTGIDDSAHLVVEVVKLNRDKPLVEIGYEVLAFHEA